MDTTSRSLITAFEQACNDVQVATTRVAAERSLSALSSRPDSIPLALSVLQCTSSPVARFHAAASLRTAARQRWQHLPRQNRHGLTSFRHILINLVVTHPDLLQYERIAILRTAAFLTRRAYLEEPPELRGAYFNFLYGIVSSPQSATHTTVATMELLDLILDEFISPPTTTTALVNSIERELFVRSRVLFFSPQGHVMLILRSALQMIQYLINSFPPSAFHSQLFFARAIPAFSVIHRILTADFNADPVMTSSDQPAVDYSPSSPASDALETVVINSFNSSEWQPLVQIIPPILNVTLTVISVLISSAETPSDSGLLTGLLNIVTAVAAISHNSYKPPQSSHDVLATIMKGLYDPRWITSPLAPVRLAYAEVWRRTSCAHGLTNVDRLPNMYVNMFTADTCNQMDATARHISQSSEMDDETFSMEIVDLLMETWANLALQADDGSALTNHPLSENIEQVVIHFIRMSLRTCGIHTIPPNTPSDIDEDFGFDDSSIDDSRISVAAILTRFVLDKTVNGLVESLLQASKKIMIWPQGEGYVNGFPLNLYLEDLYFLLQLTSSVLTDEAKGEYPSIPTQLLPPLARDVDRKGHMVGPTYAQQLISAVVTVADEESQLLSERSVHCNEASPRVGSAILDSLSRIFQTYVAPLNSNQGPDTFEIAGGSSMICRARNVCFKKSLEGLTIRGFEGDIAESAGRLLATIANASKIFPELRESTLWDVIMQSGIEAFEILPLSAVQNIGKSLTTVLGDTVTERMIIPACNTLDTFANTREIRGDVGDRAITVINLLRGAAHCNVLGAYTKQTLLRCLRAPDGIAAKCARSFGSIRPDVSRTLLQFADDIVYNALPLLDDKDARDLLSNIVRLIIAHVDIVKGCDEDAATDVEEILTLLTHVLDEEVEVDVGEACFYGLSTLIPLMSEAILDVPSVNAAYFKFVAQLVGAHADKLSQLPEEFCGKILQSINMQRVSYDPSSERKALEAIAAVARVQLKERKQSQESFKVLITASDVTDLNQKNLNDQSQGVVVRGLQEFLSCIFEGITRGSARIINMDAASDALLPLVHLKYRDGNGLIVSGFEQVGGALMRSAGNNEQLHKALLRLGQAATEAGAVHGFCDSIDQNLNCDHGDSGHNRSAAIQASRKFREAVTQFSDETRNFFVTNMLEGTLIT